MDYRKIKGVSHYVFDDRPEFEEWMRLNRGEVPPIAEDWRTAKEGDWVEADDGGIVQI